MNRYLVGAYAIVPPSDSNWNSKLEEEFFEKLSRVENIRGLEFPAWKNGNFHKQDDEWFMQQVKDKNWEMVVTCIPGTMDNLSDDPHFGLASSSNDGRKKAIEFMKKVYQNVISFNESGGSSSIIAIQIHSAPKLGADGVSSSKECFLQSLKEIASWHWGKCHIMIEHCDQFLPNKIISKGFLSLDDEVWAIEQLSIQNNIQNGKSSFGITINWGRSVLEGMSVETVHKHIKLAKEKSILNGLMFSGITDDDPLYGKWLDNHVPFSITKNAHQSLLTPEETQKAMELALGGELRESLLYLGFKLAPKPADISLSERFQVIQDAISVLNDSLSVLRKKD